MGNKYNMVTGGNFAGGSALALFGISSLITPDVTPTPDISHVMNAGELFSEGWSDDGLFGSGGELTPQCNYWAGTSFYDTTAICTPFALSRVSASIHSRALARAMACVRQSPTDCILASEIGIAIPSAFAYMDDDAFIMITAPRILNGSNPKLVKIKHPDGLSTPLRMRFNNSVTFEAILDGQRTPSTITAEGPLALCAQLLRSSIAPSESTPASAACGPRACSPALWGRRRARARRRRTCGGCATRAATC